MPFTTARSQASRAVLGAALCTLALLPRPALAELKVTVSLRSVERFQSVGVTVTDPLGGLDVPPGPITLTVADGADNRKSLALEQSERPGVWQGRFTPLSAGRFTGTVVLDRGGEKEIGLLPLVRVRKTARKGFLRLDPQSRRSLRFSTGETFFPVGLRFLPSVWSTGFDWKGEMAAIMAKEANYLELPVPWPHDQPAAERLRTERTVDEILLWAERHGQAHVQLRLEPPADVAGTGAAAYEDQLRRWARRWAYSPALAVWHVTGAADTHPQEVRERFVRAVRESDPYRHIIAVPAASPGSLAGADLPVVQRDWQRPSFRHALVEVPEDAEEPDPLPGESSWQLLAIGGVGMPLWPYDTRTEERRHLLQRLALLRRAASGIPYQAAAVPLSGVLPVDYPASLCRYGPSTIVGWVAADTAAPKLRLTGLPRGRYRVNFWDPGQDLEAGAVMLWSDGSVMDVQLPKALAATFVRITPAAVATPARRYRSRYRRPVARAAKATPPQKVAKATKASAKKSKTRPLTRAQARAAKLAAAKAAKAKKKPARRTPTRRRRR